MTWSYLGDASSATSNSVYTRKAAEDTLSLIARCLSSVEVTRHEGRAVKEMLALIESSLGKVSYAGSMNEMLSALSSLLISLGRLNVGGKTAAEVFALSLVKKVDAMRLKKGFENKDAVDGVLKSMMRAVGLDVVLEALPLGLGGPEA